MDMSEPLHVDVVFDFVCRWCYIGKRRLEAALERSVPADAGRFLGRGWGVRPGFRGPWVRAGRTASACKPMRALQVRESSVKHLLKAR
jgi:hypothetical protein